MGADQNKCLRLRHGDAEKEENPEIFETQRNGRSGGEQIFAPNRAKSAQKNRLVGYALRRFGTKRQNYRYLSRDISGWTAGAGIVCALSSGKSGSGVSSAIFNTWSIFSGTSARSFSFSLGIIASLIPARRAASSFSFNPPMGSTLPRNVISPVMAISRRTGILLNALEIAVAMVMPAEGPSLGIAPSGT